MWVTSEQAAEIYARYCRARYGSEALNVVKTRVADLRRVGDTEGELIWNKVAEEIDPAQAQSRIYSAA